MKSQHLSRETFGAQFIVCRMHGQGGPVAFAMRSPKCGLISSNFPEHLKTETSKTETLKT